MKKMITPILIASLCFPLNLFAASTSAEDVEALNLVTGVQRFELVSDAAITLEDPAGVKGVGDKASYVSIGLSGINDAHLAAALTVNENAAQKRTSTLLNRCSDEGLKELSKDSNMQLYALSCKIYGYVNTISGYFAEADQLQKMLIENKAALNQASAENAKRNADIAKEKDKLKAANKEISSAIKEIDANKKAVEAATKAVEAATKALEAASAQDCGEDEDGSCSSAKAAAVAAAQKAVDAAKAALEKATSKLNKSVAKMIDLLVNKLGVETSAVLALMSGTAVGDVDGTSINFKVAGNDFSLVNLKEVFSGMTGDSGDKAEKFVDKYAGEKTVDYFTQFIENVDTDRNANSHMGDDIKEDSSGLFTFFKDQYIKNNAPDAATSREVLTSFAGASNGLEMIETLALAISDYTTDNSSKLIEKYESMKTPESRMGAMQQKNEDLSKQLDDIKKMIKLALEQLDKTLEIYKETYKLTKTEVLNANQVKEEIFYKYVNIFMTDKMKQKMNEGYFSNVDYKGIQKEFECYVNGGTENSCKQLSSATSGTGSVAGETCHWSGAVIGPSVSPKEVCTKNNLGTILSGQEVGGTLTCQCN